MFNEHGGYYGDKDILDYSININPFGVSDMLKKKLIEDIENLDRYPEINGESMIDKISEHFQVKKNSVILGNGATELIYLFSRAICSNCRKALILEPTFTEYKKSVEINGGIVESIGSGHSLDSYKLKNLITEDIAAVFICSPNNPDGKVLEFDELLYLLNHIKDSNLETYIFLDESFIEFTDNKSALCLVENHNIFILKSVTKIYGIPGIRIGYGLGNPSIINKMNMLKEPWTVNSLALKAMETYLEDSDYISKTKEWIKTEKRLFYDELSKMEEIELFDMSANFIMFKLNAGTGEDLKKFLLDRGYYIRLCGDFYGLDNNHIRLSVRYREQNKSLIQEIKNYFRVLNGVKSC